MVFKFKEGKVMTIDLNVIIDTLWVVIASVLVFSMQAGFALVESGFTRSKNAANIMMKNFMDCSKFNFLYRYKQCYCLILLCLCFL